MLGLARMSVAKPRATLLAWGAVTSVLVVIGLGIAHSLSPSVVVVSGSEAARAQRYANAGFGPTQLVPILLEGPKTQLDGQGPRLVRALLRHPRTRALTAWDAGAASQGLRPSANAAMIVVSVDRSERAVVEKDQPQIERIVARTIHAPVRASVTGQASIDRALKSHALSVALRCELIAVAILLLLLALALRAPVAAALVTALGALDVLASNGLMALLGRVITTDAIAVPLAAVTGLALGVGYSLLILDRAHRLREAQRRERGRCPPCGRRGCRHGTRRAVRGSRHGPRADAGQRDRTDGDHRLARDRPAAQLGSGDRRRARGDARGPHAALRPRTARRIRRPGGPDPRTGIASSARASGCAAARRWRARSRRARCCCSRRLP